MSVVSQQTSERGNGIVDRVLAIGYHNLNGELPWDYLLQCTAARPAPRDFLISYEQDNQVSGFGTRYLRVWSWKRGRQNLRTNGV